MCFPKSPASAGSMFRKEQLVFPCPSVLVSTKLSLFFALKSTSLLKMMQVQSLKNTELGQGFFKKLHFTQNSWKIAEEWSRGIDMKNPH